MSVGMRFGETKVGHRNLLPASTQSTGLLATAQAKIAAKMRSCCHFIMLILGHCQVGQRVDRFIDLKS